MYFLSKLFKIAEFLIKCQEIFKSKKINYEDKIKQNFIDFTEMLKKSIVQNRIKEQKSLCFFNMHKYFYRFNCTKIKFAQHFIEKSLHFEIFRKSKKQFRKKY